MFNDHFTRPKKPRRPSCHWCGERSHEAPSCPKGSEFARLRARIAERQIEPWQPKAQP
jgi:primosomal protein N'